jgi:hypothetical protein
VQPLRLSGNNIMKIHVYFFFKENNSAMSLLSATMSGLLWDELRFCAHHKERRPNGTGVWNEWSSRLNGEHLIRDRSFIFEYLLIPQLCCLQFSVQKYILSFTWIRKIWNHSSYPSHAREWIGCVVLFPTVTSTSIHLHSDLSEALKEITGAHHLWWWFVLPVV